MTGRDSGMGFYRTARPMRIAIDIDSTLHHYWDLLEEVAQRRFGVAIPYSEQVVWEIDRLKPEQLSAAVKETHSEPQILALRALPGRRRDRPRLARGRALHPHHLAPRARRARRHRAVAGADRAALRRALLLLRQGHPLRGDRHRPADRRLAGEPAARDRRRHRRRDDPAPLEPRAVRDRGRRTAARTGTSWPATSSRCWRREAAARPPAATCATTCRRSSPSARSRTGAAPSASRGCSTRRSTSSSTTTGSAARSRGSRTSRPTAARCWSPTTPARSRPTRR